MHHDSVCTAEFRRLKEQSENANDFLWKGIKSIPTIYGKPCLEVGCSIGAQTWDLQSKMNPMVKIIGIDIDPAAIEIAGTAL
jgi:ubiquinone/menaquinone biosynthesis C-methylase UbiE